VNTNILKKFATEARRRLIEQVGTKLEYVLNIDTAELREKAKQIRELQRQIDASSKHSVIERVAYTWFNRFMALRFMDANGYTTVRAVSPVEGHTLPEILAEAKRGNVESDLKVDHRKINDLLDGRIDSPDPQTEVYKLLLVAVCNSYNAVMPFMFEAIKDYTELLMPDDLLGDGSILSDFVTNMTNDDCRNVEIVGWLYQFYISEKKDEVMARKKAVPKEDIPAVTQLFTPHWIVRYLVENSLGRLWMLNRPNSRLIERMDYYIKSEEEETDFLRISSPEEIKICDPACGSGHMLVYAFDLLYAIYEEEGYDPPEIPRLILEKNLYGIEIDERAGELAAFALFMKARERYHRFFKNPVQPNIYVLENIRFEDEELETYMDKIGRDLFTDKLRDTLYQFEEADNFGSLIVPQAKDVAEIRLVLDAMDMGGNLLFHAAHRKILRVLKMADYLSPKYHIVVTNPPYMGAKAMNATLKSWLVAHYEYGDTDLFAVFIQRSSSLGLRRAYRALITMDAWMFAPAYENFRESVLNAEQLVINAHCGPHAFDSIGGEIVSTAAFVITAGHKSGWRPMFVRLVAGRSEREKDNLLRSGRERFHELQQSDFSRITGSPLAYWLPHDFIVQMHKCTTLGQVGKPRSGLTTGDNDRFLRRWFEVSKFNGSIDDIDYPETTFDTWVPLNGGSSFRKWYGSNTHVIYWKSNGKELRSSDASTMANPEFQFKPGVTWSKISGMSLSARRTGHGFIFSAVGLKAFPPVAMIDFVCGFLNSKIVRYLVPIFSSNLTILSGDIAKYPLPIENRAEIDPNVGELCAIGKADWDSYETSWDFTTLPLLEPDYRQSTLNETYNQLRTYWNDMTEEMRMLEEKNNRIFIEAYGLQDELTPDVPLEEITLTSNPRYRYGGKKSNDELEELLLADTMREFLSYAVGCIFGRYSLDKPGLILTNQGETLKDFLKQVPEPSFMPDEDNVIPVLDDEYFTDDIVGRFKKFLRVTFGDDHYDENLAFIESAIGKDIRKYFMNDFYNHHVKIYKKRPIYWMFSSPKKSFNVLIYMHRYRSDTVSRILNEYLREFQEKLRARKANQQEISISESARASEKSKANKEIARIDKIMAELDDYERNVLYHLAAKKIEIDLDDGVKVNYNKFGVALRKITGLSGE